jgi:hypothetical protein
MAGKIGLTRDIFFTIVVPIILSILLFVFVIIVLVFYFIEASIGPTDKAGYWINNKTSFYHKNYTIYYYDLTVVCRSEFYLLFDVINFKKEQTNTSIDGVTLSTTFAGESDIEKIMFNSKRGRFYWHVDVIVIASSDGNFCVLDKKTKIVLSQLREVCKDNSLIKIEHNIPMQWRFEPSFRKNTRMLIETSYSFANANYAESNNHSQLALTKFIIDISIEPK